MKKTDLNLRGHISGQFKTNCPLCHAGRKNQNDPSLQVNLDTGGFTCWNCGEKGYLEDVQNTNPYANRKSAKQYKRPDPEALVKASDPLPEIVLEYFKGRGISETTLIRWGISYGPSFAKRDAYGQKAIVDGIPQYDRAVRFPFYENGELVWVKMLRPKEWNESGARRIGAFPDGKPVPFGLDRAGERIVIHEGEIDAMSSFEAGIDEVWSVPNGAKALGWLEFESVVDKLLAAKAIYIAVDADNDGQDLQEELIRRLKLLVGIERIAIVSWPDGCKDANDVLVKHGPAKLKQCIIEDAKAIPIDGISEIDEFVNDYMQHYTEGLPKGLSTGIPGLDNVYRVMPGMWTTITGVTNYGKSELMDQVVCNMIEQHGWKFAFYTPENYPMSLHMIKVAEKHIGKPFDKEKTGHMSQDEAMQAAGWMQQSMFYINPRNQTYSIDEILERAKVLIYRKGINGLVIDPWNYVRKDFGGLREDQYINQEMQKIGVFTRLTGIHVWLTVHPRTLRKDKDSKIEVPTIMELSGGSKFGDNTDFMFAVHRDPKKAFATGIHEVTIHVQKSRYRPAAVQGSHTVLWNPFNGRFDAEAGTELGPTEDAYIPDEEDGF